MSLATRALELDASESTCHALLGDICVQRRSFERAVQYSRRAVEINPTNPWNAADLGSILVYVGESQEALSWFAKARQIDPYFDEAWYWRIAAIAHMLLRRYETALAALAHERMRRYHIQALTAGCQAELGAMELAKASVVECLTLRRDFSINQFVSRLPFKIAGHAEQLASSLRLAGLPGLTADRRGPGCLLLRGDLLSVRHSTEGNAEPTWVLDVLRFWFAELGEAHWFATRADVDGQIRDRFLSLHEWLVTDDGFTAKTPRTFVAAVIVLDQFSA